MKRTLSILVLVLVCCTLTSCKEIKEPKIKGDLISDSIDGNLSAEEYIETYYNERAKGFDTFDQWYKVNMAGEVNVSDEEEGYNINAKIQLKGKILDAEYDFEEKGKLSYTMDMSGEVPASDDGDVKSEVSLKCTIDLTYLEGKTYMKLKMNGKVDKDTFKFTFKSNMNSLKKQLESALDSMGDMADLEILGDILELEVFDAIFECLDPEYVLDILKDAIDNENSKIYLHKDKYTVKTVEEYSSSYEINNFTQISSFELDEYNYQILSYDEYVRQYFEYENSKFETIASIEIDTALFGIVNEPLNKAKYQ